MVILVLIIADILLQLFHMVDLLMTIQFYRSFHVQINYLVRPRQRLWKFYFYLLALSCCDFFIEILLKCTRIIIMTHKSF